MGIDRRKWPLIRTTPTSFRRQVNSQLGRKRMELRPDRRAMLPVAIRPRPRAKPPTIRPILTRRLLLVPQSLAKVGRRTGTSTKDGRVAVLNSSTIVKFARFLAPVLKHTRTI